MSSLQITQRTAINKAFEELNPFDAFFPYGSYMPNRFFIKIPYIERLVDIGVNAIAVTFGKPIKGEIVGYRFDYVYFGSKDIVVELPSSMSVTMPER